MTTDNETAKDDKTEAIDEKLTDYDTTSNGEVENPAPNSEGPNKLPATSNGKRNLQGESVGTSLTNG